MQNKGFIRVFTVLLILASLYSLSFTFFVEHAKNNAEEYAQGDFDKHREFMDSVEADEGFYNFLGLRKFTYKECQARELNLGLDLKGGMNVMMEVSIRDMIINLSDRNEQDTMLMKTLDRADELERDGAGDFVASFGQAFEELYPGQNLRLLFLANEDIKDKINFRSTNKEVLAVLTKEAEAAYDNTFNIIRTRIDRFGVAQPNIQKVGERRILVELPGVNNPERVRDLLESSADLEFWETYNAGEVIQVLFDINTLLAETNKINEEQVAETPSEGDNDVTAPADSVSQTDTSELSLKDQILQDTLAQTEATDDKSREEMKRENPLFFHLTPNISRDGRPGIGPVVGYATDKDIVYIDSILALPEVQNLLKEQNPELKLAWSRKAEENGFYTLVALKDLGANRKPALDGDVVVDARPEFSQTSSYASVQMTMNNEGAREWRRVTKDNIDRSVAIVLDGYVYSFPTVQNEISDGISSITGNFTIAEATDMANILKSGKLAAKANIISAEFVGPTLGQESARSGILSFVLSFILVLVFMFFYYRKAGLIANIALLLNIFLVFGVLASLGAALTLPGIAGLVLTIGMSVDANVIIFERIREELAQGKGVKLAISDGYKNAYSAIIDANVTTIIIGIILFSFGSGPIQGFATTLIIGILTSLFCVIFITRLSFELFLEKHLPISFDTKVSRNAFTKFNFDFIAKRKTFYMISAAIILLGIGSMVTRQWSLGVDFKGGRSYIVRVDGERNTTQIAEDLTSVFESAPEVKTYGNLDVKITTDYMINEKGAHVDSIVETKLFEGLQPVLDEDTDFNTFITQNIRQSDMVGPTIASDIIYGAVISITLALLFIFLYIFVRFRNWQYGLGAVAALFHDVLIVLGIFSLLWGRVPFSLEIDQAFIAAILTVIGYSINDTVIVFDRVREITTNYPKRKTIDLFNQGLNGTISRTAITSLTTLLVLIAILIFGGESIRGFVFAMTIGIVVGTYSSLCVASPISFEFLKKKNQITE
ncbi:MAG: protein translocase subunit SecDF [Bacteroidales bacterium]|jgi:SecD/SecF fusion protein|nr:protein translocase subunit SecDF [Bacteroidales bacterium]